MGVGKTSIGRIVAPRLSLAFVDIDDFIESQANMSIVRIFSQFGETEFRRREENALREVVARNEGMLIATGGGAFINKNCEQIMSNAGTTVWLDVPLEELSTRPSTETRPLWSDDVKVQRSLFQKRLTHYQKADLHLELSGTALEEAAERLYQLLAPFCNIR